MVTELKWLQVENFSKCPIVRFGNTITPRSIHGLSEALNGLGNLHTELSGLLAYWTMDRVHDEAWLLAYSWQSTPPLVEDYDHAYLYVLALRQYLVDNTNRDHLAPAQVSALTSIIDSHMEELRSRTQFLQTRAGDIRLNATLADLRETIHERAVTPLMRLLEEAAQSNKALVTSTIQSERSLRVLVEKAMQPAVQNPYLDLIERVRGNFTPAQWSAIKLTLSAVGSVTSNVIANVITEKGLGA